MTRYALPPASAGLGMMSAEGREEGGPVEPGKPYVVGEGGPEVIVPRGKGTVIPGNMLTRLLFELYNHIEQKARDPGQALNSDQMEWDKMMKLYGQPPGIGNVRGERVPNPDPAIIYQTPSLGYRG